MDGNRQASPRPVEHRLILTEVTMLHEQHPHPPHLSRSLVLCAVVSPPGLRAKKFTTARVEKVLAAAGRQSAWSTSIRASPATTRSRSNAVQTFKTKGVISFKTV